MRSLSVFCFKQLGARGVSQSVVSKEPEISQARRVCMRGSFAVCWAVREVLDWWCQRSEANSLCVVVVCLCAKQPHSRSREMKPRAAKRMRWKIYFLTPPLTADAIFLLRQQIADGSLRWWIIELEIIDLRVWAALLDSDAHHFLTQREKCAPPSGY